MINRTENVPKVTRKCTRRDIEDQDLSIVLGRILF